MLENLYRQAILPEASAHVPRHALVSVALNSFEDIDSVKQSINLDTSILVFYKDPAAVGNMVFFKANSKGISLTTSIQNPSSIQI